MKIALVYDMPYPWHNGGIEYMLYNYAIELAKKHEVHFFTLRWPGMEKEFIYKGIHYHAFGNATEKTAYRHGRRSIREAAAFSLYSTALLGHKFDVIMTDLFPLLHLPFLRLQRSMRGSRLVLIASEVWDRAYWKKYIGAIGTFAYAYSKKAINAKATYIAISSATANALKREGIKDGRIMTFAPVLESSLFKKTGKAKKGADIIFSCRFIKEKRLDAWLNVVKEISKKRKIRAVLIGDGVEKDNLIAQIHRLGLEDTVTLKPFYKDKTKLYGEIAGASILLNMSEREGLSIITMESVALGTPALIPKESPIPDEVKAMCTMEKEQRIAEKALEMINSKDKRKYLRNTKNLERFRIDNVNSFFSKLTSETG